MKNTKSKLFYDAFLMVLVLLICAIWIIFLNRSQSLGAYANITLSDGRSFIVSLNEDETYIYQTDLGFNEVCVKNGKIFVTDSDCKGRQCVNQKAISKSEESIVCLPHKMIISITNEESAGFDAITY